MSDKGFVISNIKNGVGEIEFYHPKSNSLSSDLLSQLAISIQDFGSNPEVKVILLSSDGDKAFCAGASFDELLRLKTESEGEKFFNGFGNVILSIKSARKFVVVKVQGKTVGGGVGIACAADYAIATESASVKLSELFIGIGPFVIGAAVKRKIGLANFSSLAMNSSQWKDSDWGRTSGMYNEVVLNKEALNSRTDALISELITYSPEAMVRTKEMFWEGAENLESIMKDKAKQNGSLVLSEFTKQKLNSFKNK
jgi:methylglutaconyl-CoA hydratase